MEQEELLVFASKEGRIDIIKSFDEEINFNYLHSLSLKLASKNGHLEIVQYLTSKVEEENFEKVIDISLYLSVKYGHLEVVKFLQKKRKPLSEERKKYLFQVAIRNGHLSIVDYLLDDQLNLYEYPFPIYLAAEEGHLYIVKYLLSKGANCSGNLNTGLRVAAMNGHLGIVKLLLHSGVDVFFNQNEALFWAMRNGKEEIVKYLSLYFSFLESHSSYSLPIRNFIEKFNRDPEKTKIEVRIENGIHIDWLIHIILYTDNYLALKEENKICRLLKIASSLPYELQVILSHRLIGSSKERISIKDFNQFLPKIIGDYF